MNSVPMKALRPIVDFASNGGIEVDRLLKMTDISLQNIQESSNETISIEQEHQVYRNLLDVTEDNCIGLKLGSYFKLESYGVLGFTIMSCKTIEDSINIAEHYDQLSFTRSKISRVLTDDTAGVEFIIDKNQPGDLARLYGDRDLAASKEALSHQGQLIIPLKQIGLPHSDIDSLVRYKDAFNCDIAFEVDSNQLHFDRKFLSHPLPLSDVETYTYCQKQCESLLEKIDSGSLRIKVLELLRSDIDQYSNLDAVADCLKLNPRTFRRYLEREQINFQSILRQARSDHSKELLHEGVPIHVISEILGYSEPANFSNAFKKWNGVSPSAYLNQI